jgi:hypothetical protein
MDSNTNTQTDITKESLMESTFNRVMKHPAGYGYRYRGIDIIREGRKFTFCADRSPNGFNDYRTYATLKQCVAHIDRITNK